MYNAQYFERMPVRNTELSVNKKYMNVVQSKKTTVQNESQRPITCEKSVNRVESTPKKLRAYSP